MRLRNNGAVTGAVTVPLSRAPESFPGIFLSDTMMHGIQGSVPKVAACAGVMGEDGPCWDLQRLESKPLKHVRFGMPFCVSGSSPGCGMLSYKGGGKTMKQHGLVRPSEQCGSLICVTIFFGHTPLAHPAYASTRLELSSCSPKISPMCSSDERLTPRLLRKRQ